MAAGTESLDAQLLKDLRGLGKPASFDGNDAEYQDFRFRLKIHMSLVSSVSHELMDRCEVERNPISLTAVRALGDAHLKCCIHIAKHSKSTIGPDAEDHDACETLL